MNIKKGALAATVAAASLTVAACTSASSTGATGGSTPTVSAATGSSPASTGTSSHITIGFANPQDTQPVLQAFQAALTAAANRVGDKVIALNAGLSANQQVSDINTLVTDKVNVLIVFPLAPTLGPALEAAHKAGIKLIGYNALVPTGTAPATAAPFDADLDQGIVVQGAKDAASYVASTLNGKGNVLGINIGAPVPSLVAMVGNYKADVTAGHPGIKWLETAPDATDSLSGGQTAMADAITRYHGNIQAVMSYTDEAAIGAYNALKAAGVKNTVIIGQQGDQDGINALKAGKIQGDIDTQPWKEALYALKMAQDLVAGTPVPALVEYPSVFITKANLSSYVPWSTAIQQISSGAMSLNVSF